MKKKTLSVFILLLIPFLLIAKPFFKVSHQDWSEDVKTAINDMMRDCRSNNNYVVFDFDNTCSVFDIEEQMVAYQLQTMAFAFTPDELPQILASDIGDLDIKRNTKNLQTSYRDLIYDISTAYSYLWDNYGPFNAGGLSRKDSRKIQRDPYWSAFATKMRVMYELIGDCESTDVSYPWLTYWFKGMTEEELYELSCRSYMANAKLRTSQVTWTVPQDLAGKAGVTSCTFINGISVTDNIKELWKCLTYNDIDVWVCSASATGVIKGAIDCAGLHRYCKGLLAMTDKFDEEGRYLSKYDYETGCGYYSSKNRKWTKMTDPIKCQTQGKGKVIAIQNALFPIYNKGPVAGFMDSTGDFNFCTEFDSLKMVTCFNRANRKVTDGGALIAELAIYQKELGQNYKTANENNDIFFVLQGREENKGRGLRSSNKTVRFNEQNEKLFANKDNETQLEYMKSNNLSVKDIVNTFCIKTSKEKSELGFAYGFLERYDGYKNIK